MLFARETIDTRSTNTGRSRPEWKLVLRMGMVTVWVAQVDSWTTMIGDSDMPLGED